ncbi:MAG: hypothetical protein HFG22_16575 [Lachnospiraceae bacterium]|nr:hypothetical protein [Lachnospiraceae bacterium]
MHPFLAAILLSLELVALSAYLAGALERSPRHPALGYLLILAGSLYSYVAFRIGSALLR